MHPQYKRDGKSGKWVDTDVSGGWYYKHNPAYYPNGQQKSIFRHFEKSLELEAERRRDKDLILILNGDLIDGNHHGTHQLTTRIISEQVKACAELIEYAKEKLKYKKGSDNIYVITGTETHVGDEEQNIAERIGANEYGINRYDTDFLQLYMGDYLMWIYHHGTTSGEAPGRGNALRNRLRKIYYDCLEEGRRYPNLVVTSHTHDADHVTFESRFNKIDGIILPSLQGKTRYANGKIPTAVNKIGIWGMDFIDGKMNIEPPFLMEQPLGDTVKIGQTWYNALQEKKK